MMKSNQIGKRSLLVALAALPLFSSTSCVEIASDFLLGREFFDRFDNRDTGDRLDDLFDDFEDLADDIDDLF